MAEKRRRSQKLIEDIAKLADTFPVLKKSAAEFAKAIKDNASTIDNFVSASFKEMVQKRQAMKYAEKSEAQFQAEMKAYIAAQTEIFKRSQTLTKDDIKKFKAMTMKAQATKEAKKKEDEDPFSID